MKVSQAIETLQRILETEGDIDLVAQGVVSVDGGFLVGKRQINALKLQTERVWQAATWDGRWSEPKKVVVVK